MKRAGFRSELTTIVLDETGDGAPTSWVQALKCGRYQHPYHGEINLDEPRMNRFADNANNGVRGIELDIDYDHKSKRDDAAGWVKRTEARDGGLWYQVEWTEEAARKIKAREYKYFSSEFADEWTDPVSGATYMDVMFGGGMTNRPFIKGMAPLNLSGSEAEQARLAEVDPTPPGAGGATEGGNMGLEEFLKAVRSALKLSEGTSDDDVLTAIVAKLAEPAPQPVPVPPADDEVQRLAETNPVIARMLADADESKRRLAEMETAYSLSEVRRTLAEVDEGTELAVTTAVKGLAETLMIKLPASGRTELTAILKHFAEGKGTVKLGEPARVGGNHKDGGSTDAVKAFTELIAKIELDEKLTYRNALSAAIQRNPTLYESYRAATEAFKVVGS